VIRVGLGYDVHALVPGRRLVLGGVQIDSPLGLLGHSDGDVLLHAITDALLGAAGLGDIGRLFPDSDEAHRGADSLEMLRAAAQRVRAAGWTVGNVDAVVVAQRPRIAAYVPQMQARIAPVLGVAEGAVGIKGKSTEHLGFAGRGEGIAAQAVALLVGEAAAPGAGRP
jgi:2-C-methyl-D-erythritol 2,4-cyclodiphosphate synthase